jgi:hypothetical protein
MAQLDSSLRTNAFLLVSGHCRERFALRHGERLGNCIPIVKIGDALHGDKRVGNGNDSSDRSSFFTITR